MIHSQFACCFVSQAKIYIDPNSLFQNEVEDVNIRVKTVISTVSDFKYELLIHYRK